MQIGLAAAAFFTAGASLAYVTPTDLISFAAKIIAVPVAFGIVELCGPQIIAPAEAVAGQSHLDCTSG